MRLNYKSLGKYIEPVNQLNDGMEVKELLGISNQKFFQNSHTNTIGIDLQAYRIVRTNQFAYNRATTRNGDKISIALRQGTDCIVSPSYRIFRSKDESVLHSEYLMMWFKRSEFDRYARFKSHGSAHEFFEYDQMCQVELPIPSITKQREIVKEYNTIQNRIKLNEQLIQKLEETAKAIYKEWFVEFEFPDENGKTYKSNGGEMVWNEELGKEIPKGWEVEPFTKVVKFGGGGTPSTEHPEYWNGDVPFYTPGDLTQNYYCISTEKKITPLGLKKCSSKLYPINTIFVTARGATVGGVGLAGIPMAMNQTCYAVNGNGSNDLYIHQLTLEVMSSLKNEAVGATFEALVTKDFDSQMVISPSLDLTKLYSLKMEKLYQFILNKIFENQKVCELKDLLLSKLATVEN